MLQEREARSGQIRSLLDEAWHEFSAEARRRPLDETVSRRVRDGKAVHLTRGAVLTHVATHGMHHRAQCPCSASWAAKPLPRSSVAEWIWQSDTQE